MVRKLIWTKVTSMTGMLFFFWSLCNFLTSFTQWLSFCYFVISVKFVKILLLLWNFSRCLWVGTSFTQWLSLSCEEFAEKFTATMYFTVGRVILQTNFFIFLSFLSFFFVDFVVLAFILSDHYFCLAKQKYSFKISQYLFLCRSYFFLIFLYASHKWPFSEWIFYI